MSHYHCMCCWQVRLIALLTSPSWNGWIGRWHQSSFISDLFYTCALVLCICFWSNWCAVFLSSGNKNQAWAFLILFLQTHSYLFPQRVFPFFLLLFVQYNASRVVLFVDIYMHQGNLTFLLELRALLYAMGNFSGYLQTRQVRDGHTDMCGMPEDFFFFHSMTSLETAHYQRVTLQ